MTNNPFNRGADSASIERLGMDAGLRAHMLRVYNYMGLGVAITGLIAWLVGNNPALYSNFFNETTHQISILGWIAMFAPLVFVLFMQFASPRSSAATLQTMFWIYCALMGVSMFSVFMIFTGASIANTFFVVAAMFGATSLWGYTTKADLSKMGSFCIMAVWGIFFASLANLFFQSGMVHFVISCIGVVAFVGLTAWDTQRIKDAYSESNGSEANNKMAVLGALYLYLDFVNLFQFMLQFMGNRRN